MQTGSGKTYTMGTGFKDGCSTGIIPQVMNVLFSKIETLKNQMEFQLHVSFIEVVVMILSSMTFYLFILPNILSPMCKALTKFFYGKDSQGRGTRPSRFYFF